MPPRKNQKPASPLTSHTGVIQDRAPEERKRGRKPHSVGLLHLHTIEWAEEVSRSILTVLHTNLVREGRADAAGAIDFALKKIQSAYLREHNTQRIALKRANQRQKDRLDRELHLNKMRAREMEDALDRIEAAQKKIDAYHRRASNQSRGLRYQVGEQLLEFTVEDEDAES